MVKVWYVWNSASLYKSLPSFIHENPTGLLFSKILEFYFIFLSLKIFILSPFFFLSIFLPISEETYINHRILPYIIFTSFRIPPSTILNPSYLFCLYLSPFPSTFSFSSLPSSRPTSFLSLTLPPIFIYTPPPFSYPFLAFPASISNPSSFCSFPFLLLLLFLPIVFFAFLPLWFFSLPQSTFPDLFPYLTSPLLLLTFPLPFHLSAHHYVFQVFPFSFTTIPFLPPLSTPSPCNTSFGNFKPYTWTNLLFK